jgi:hypothetical protein
MSTESKIVCPGLVKARYSGWSVMTTATPTTSPVVLLGDEQGPAGRWVRDLHR